MNSPIPATSFRNRFPVQIVPGGPEHFVFPPAALVPHIRIFTFRRLTGNLRRKGGHSHIHQSLSFPLRELCSRRFFACDYGTIFVNQWDYTLLSGDNRAIPRAFVEGQVSIVRISSRQLTATRGPKPEKKYLPECMIYRGAFLPPVLWSEMIRNSSGALHRCFLCLFTFFVRRYRDVPEVVVVHTGAWLFPRTPGRPGRVVDSVQP